MAENVHDPVVGDCGTGQLTTGFVPASTLLHSKGHPQHSPTPAGPTPSDSDATSSLSRESTLSSISSFSSEKNGSDSNAKLCRILEVVEEVVDECRICWVNRTASHPHTTYRCPTKICSGVGWKRFKANLQFPSGKICYFCFAPFGPPFNHRQPPPGTQRSADLCDYPDVLKELLYILYHNESLRKKVFSKLGHSTPSSLSLYKRYISKMQCIGILGAYNVIDAYLDVREGGELLG